MHQIIPAFIIDQLVMSFGSNLPLSMESVLMGHCKILRSLVQTARTYFSTRFVTLEGEWKKFRRRYAHNS